MKIIFLLILFSSSKLCYSQLDSNGSSNNFIEFPLSGKPHLLSNNNKKIIDSFCLVLLKKANPKIAITAFDGSCEKCQQLSWDRAYAVYKYLRTKQVDSSSIVFYYGYPDGDSLNVLIRSGLRMK